MMWNACAVMAHIQGASICRERAAGKGLQGWPELSDANHRGRRMTGKPLHLSVFDHSIPAASSLVELLPRLASLRLHDSSAETDPTAGTSPTPVLLLRAERGASGIPAIWLPHPSLSE
jgi:hypothetical protein